MDSWLVWVDFKREWIYEEVYLSDQILVKLALEEGNMITV